MEPTRKQGTYLGKKGDLEQGEGMCATVRGAQSIQSQILSATF